MARFRLLLVALAVWLTLFFNIERPDVFGLGTINLASVTYIIAASAAVTVLLLPDLGKRWEFVFLLSLVIYGAARLFASNSTAVDTLTLPIIITEVVALFLTILIARTVSLAIVNFEQAVENVVLRPETSQVLPMAQGEDSINGELSRGRRFDRPVGFILVRITSMEGMRPKSADQFDLEATFRRRFLQLRIANTIELMLYRGDIIAWHNDNLVICLPETDLEDAKKFARQIHSLLRIRLNVDVPMGVTAFPEGGFIFRDLMDSALLTPMHFDESDSDQSSPGGSSGSSSGGGRSAEVPPNLVESRAEPAPEAQPSARVSLFKRLGGLMHTSFLPTIVPEVSKSPVQTVVQPGDPDFWVTNLPYQSASSRSIYRVFKRSIDLTLVIASLPFSTLAIGMLSLLVFLDSGRPIFFVQERTGLGGRRFKMYKFRTMVPNAEAMLKELEAKGLAKLDRSGKLAEPLKMENDPRRTRMGRILRKTSLDELPQIYNVLRGDMSLVGPRPTSWDTSSYTLLQTERLSVRPGITGLWQVYSRGTTNFDTWLQWDMLYIDKMSLTLDYQIIVRTVTKALSGRDKGAR